MSQTQPQSLLDEAARLESLRDDQCGQHRRRDRRFVVRGDADLIDINRAGVSDAVVSVMLRDISRSGVGFITDQALEVGSAWRLRILQQRHGVSETDVIVRFTRPTDGGVYIVGCQVCVQEGLMVLLGVEPNEIGQGDGLAEAAEGSFLTPDEL